MSGQPSSTETAQVPLLLQGIRNKMLILDVERCEWKRLTLNVPSCDTHSQGAACLNGEIYVFGGNDGKDLKCAFKLNRNFKCECLPDMHEERSGISNSCVLLDGCIWVMGGCKEGKSIKSVEAYDPTSNSWIRKPDMNVPRSSAAAAVANGRLFICGGLSTDDVRETTVEVFDPHLSRWTFCTPMPAPRSGLAAVILGSFLIVMGGEQDDGEDTATVWRLSLFDVKSDWTTVLSMNTPRSDFSATVIGSRIMVAGGWNNEDGDLASVEMFDGKEWTPGPELPSEMQNMPTAMVSQELALTLLEKFSEDDDSNYE